MISPARLFSLMKREAVLSAAAALALLSMLWVPPDGAYLSYVDWRTMAQLFCLMAVMAGLRELGVFSRLGRQLLCRARSARQLECVLVFLCFFTSMAITNDVALLTFVPFSLEVLTLAGREERAVPVVVFQTVAANLGSMATPIGNLGDLSPRGVQTLQEADFIAAEDTRVSMKLLNHFDIKKPLVSYHEHNRAAAGQAILARLLAGETCALVTDAGTPAISDPGEDLVRLCGENSVTVQAIPGCCAAVCALAVSGLPTGRFTFEGFLSANKKERREALTRLAAEERTMVFHEAPHKLRPTLADMLELLGDRPVALCRELTKLHEETIRTTLSGAVALYREKEPRGEYVLVVAGAPRQEAPALTLAEGVAMVQSLRQQGQRMKDAVRRVAEDTGLSRNELYQAALQEE